MKLNVSFRDGYDLACALRGPDIKPRDEAEERFIYLLKAHTACRLRCLAGCMIDSNITNRPISPHDQEKLLEYGEKIGDRLTDYSHYIYHVKVGTIALRRLVQEREIEMRRLADLMNALLYCIGDLERAAKNREG